MVTAQDVAKILLAWANRNGDVITNLKLQKLLYYAQAWYLVNFNKRLFSDDIEAWDLGPVVRNVYNAFRKYQSSPIPYKESGNEENALQPHQIEFLRDFHKVFSNLSATALVSMTHAEKPWKKAFAIGQSSVINPSIMRTYYLDRYNRDHKHS